MDIKENQYQEGMVKETVHRADGSVEVQWSKNLFLNQGMDYLAAFQSTTVTSVMNYMIVGTATVAATLTDVATTMGEIDRNIMATRTSPALSNVLTEVATFAGGLDSITSASIRELGVINDARSGGFGSLRSRTVFGSAIVLASSDFVNFSYVTTVSSR